MSDSRLILYSTNSTTNMCPQIRLSSLTQFIRLSVDLPYTTDSYQLVVTVPQRLSLWRRFIADCLAKPSLNRLSFCAVHLMKKLSHIETNVHVDI